MLMTHERTFIRASAVDSERVVSTHDILPCLYTLISCPMFNNLVFFASLYLYIGFLWFDIISI